MSARHLASTCYPLAAKVSITLQGAGMGQLIILFDIVQQNETLYVDEIVYTFAAQTGMQLSGTSTMRGIAQLQFTFTAINSFRSHSCMPAALLVLAHI